MEGNTKFNFEDLNVYQKAINFVDAVYEVTKPFPKEERYGLSSQFIKAATSIALNIAEGSGGTDPQFNRFLQIALGSVKESVVCITISKRQGYLTPDKEIEMREDLEELSKLITGLQKYLKTNKSSTNKRLETND